jgi:hypothetical protein
VSVQLLAILVTDLVGSTGGVSDHRIVLTPQRLGLTFELNGIILAANSNFVLRDDPAVLRTAKNIVRRRLGMTTTTRPPKA